MSTALVPAPISSVVVRGDDIEVSAATPIEMAQSQDALIAWCEHKIKLVREEASELLASYQEAVAHKWKSSTLMRHADLAAKRVQFYQKMKKALEAGYIIVPSFPVTVFAVRTERGRPLKLVSSYKYASHEQSSEAPPEGAGEYKNPFPEVYERDDSYQLSEEERKKGKERMTYFAEAWKEMEFPMNMARPRIMQATSRAMALKLFDDLGVFPDPSPKRDPVLIARIKDPTSPRYAPRFVSFLVAWFLDTRTL